jgi:hypothetical protein
MVVQRRHPQGHVHADGRLAEGAVGVAVFAPARIAAVDRLRLVAVRMAGPHRDVEVLRGVLDAHRLCPGSGLLQGLGHHQGHEPAPVRHVRVLQHGERRVLRLGDPRRVLMGEHGQDTRQPQSRRGVDGRHPAPGDRGRHRPGLGPARQGVLGGVAGGAGDLQTAFAALDGRAQRGTGAGHGLLLKT